MRILSRISRRLVVGLVTVSVWLFASAEPWAWLGVTLGIMVAVFLWAMAWPRSEAGGRLRAPWVVLWLSLLLLFILIQAVPLPVSWVERCSPEAAKINRTTLSLLHDMGEPSAPDPGGKTTLSLSPGTTFRNAILFSACLGIFLVMANALRRWQHLQEIAAILTVSGFLLAFLGLLHRFSGSTDIFWFHTPRYGGDIFGPFTNKNHFAAHMNLLMGIALALFLSSSRFREMLDLPDMARRMRWLSKPRAARVALTGFAVLLLGGAMCMTLSRGGIASFVASIGILILLASSRGAGSGRSRSALISAFLLVIAAVIWLGWRPVVERLGTLEKIARDPLQDLRTVITLDTLTLFGAFPGFGAGFGAYRHVFPMFQSPALDIGRWTHAHNDWAQLLAEGGLTGAFLVLMVVAAWVSDFIQAYRTAEERERRFATGLLLGLIAMALHSFVDYSLHKPANLFLLAILAGLATACVHHRHAWEEEIKPGRPGIWRGIAAPGLLMAGSLLVMGLAGVEWKGELAVKRFQHMERMAAKCHYLPHVDRVVLETADEVAKVIRQATRHPDAVRESGEFCLTWALDRGLTEERRVFLAGLGLKAGVAAVNAAKSDYLAWLVLGQAQAILGRWDGALVCLERSRELKPHGREPTFFKTRGRRK